MRANRRCSSPAVPHLHVLRLSLVPLFLGHCLPPISPSPPDDPEGFKLPDQPSLTLLNLTRDANGGIDRTSYDIAQQQVRRCDTVMTHSPCSRDVDLLPCRPAYCCCCRCFTLAGSSNCQQDRPTVDWQQLSRDTPAVALPAAPPCTSSRLRSPSQPHTHTPPLFHRLNLSVPRGCALHPRSARFRRRSSAPMCACRRSRSEPMSSSTPPTGQTTTCCRRLPPSWSQTARPLARPSWLLKAARTATAVRKTMQTARQRQRQQQHGSSLGVGDGRDASVRVPLIDFVCSPRVVPCP